VSCPGCKGARLSVRAEPVVVVSRLLQGRKGSEDGPIAVENFLDEACDSASVGGGGGEGS